MIMAEEIKQKIEQNKIVFIGLPRDRHEAPTFFNSPYEDDSNNIQEPWYLKTYIYERFEISPESFDDFLKKFDNVDTIIWRKQPEINKDGNIDFRLAAVKRGEQIYLIRQEK